MTTPMVGIGHDIVLGLLNPIIPVPQHGSVGVVERNYGLGNFVHDQGLYVPFYWSHVDGESEYITILNLFGILGDDTSNVTVYVRNRRLQWTLYNGVAYLPEPREDMKWSNFFPRDITLYVCDLEEFA